jgi:hypothetical protein
MSKVSLLIVACVALFALGCEAPELPASATASSPPAATPAAEETTGEFVPKTDLPEIETPVTDVPRKFDSHDPIKGRRSRDAGGYMGGVAGARFYAEYQTIINNIDHALQLYEAEHGERPKTHEEFWQRIIVANGAAAAPPEIEPDHEYIYVPEQAAVGLQIRLKPGSPSSKLPAPAPGQEHVFDPQAVAAAGVAVPGADGGGAAQPAAEPASEEPPTNLRERAEQLNERANSRTEEHGLAPGGLAPVGGLGVDGF